MKKIYFITDHKTGTLWTGKILELFCANTNYMFISVYRNGIKGIKNFYINFKKLSKKDKIKFIYNYFTKDKIYLLTRADIKKVIKKHPSIVIIRDPRDICISAANYDGKDNNQDLKDKHFYKYQNHIKFLTFEEILLTQAHNTSLETIKRLDNFIKNNPTALVVKYEDFFLDIDNEYLILEKIFKYLNFDEIEKNNFKTFYKITHIKNSGKSSHVNSGQPKQFKTLSTKTIDTLNFILKEYILRFKYSID
jgi:hypothetical protein